MAQQKKDQQTFGSFADLGRYVQANAKHTNLNEAATLAQAGRGDEAAALLDRHDLGGEPQAERLRYGWCYVQSAKAAINRAEWSRAHHRLVKALNLGYQPWHVHRRLGLVNEAAAGAPRVLRPTAGDWVDRCMADCQSCVPEPTPLTCARCRGILKEPCRPVYQANVARLFALGVYRWQGDPDSFNPLSRMIRWLKGNEGKDSCRYLAYLLVEGLREHEGSQFLVEADVVVPVPSDPQRGRERGFDNIMELASHVEGLALLPLARDVLLKTRPTEDLRHLAWGQRGAALAGSMEVAAGRRHLVADATVLLVDDVVTSGSTLDLCAGILRRSGARRVLAAALARSESTPASERFGG